MLRVLLLGALGPAALGLHALLEPQPHGSQCIEQDCFALFLGPAAFAAASQACERRRGHLMTVLSSVAADVISLLLSGGGAGARLWIGLKLPPGCGDPGPRGPLRGFQWVTGDNRTSYTGWARPREDSAPPCGPLCVVVSAAGVSAPGQPAWEEQPCAAEADGFLCEFNFPASCRPLALEPSTAAVSVAYATPFGVRGADFQALPVRSSAEVAALGVALECTLRPGELEGRWGRAEPGAWDCGVENGGCQHACSRGAGGPRCLCPADVALRADGRSCAAPGDHPCHELCEHACILDADQPRGYSCWCEAGYRLAADQHGCEDVDDCAQVPSPCPQRCVNAQGGFKCHCYPGYDQVDGECVKAEDPCAGNDCEYQCQPLGRAGHRCICAQGFAPVPHSPHRCQMFCNQTECPADCDPNSPASCQCPDGYILDGGSMCSDIDECDNDSCLNALSCRNLPGTYECVCGPGWVRTGGDCDAKRASEGEGEGVGEGEGEGEGGDGGSGQPPGSPTPGAPSSPAPAGSLHSGVLVGISISSLSLVVALLALVCHLRKKQGSARAELEYKCGVPAKEVVLEHVRTEQAPQKL